MHQLLIKSLVLSGVIGGSSFVAWQAHNGMQATQQASQSSDFKDLKQSADAQAASTEDLPDWMRDDPFSEATQDEPQIQSASALAANDFAMSAAGNRSIPAIEPATSSSESAREFDDLFAKFAAPSQSETTSEQAPSDRDEELAPAAPPQGNPFLALPDQKVAESAPVQALEPEATEPEPAVLPEPEPIAQTAAESEPEPTLAVIPTPLPSLRMFTPRTQQAVEAPVQNEEPAESVAVLPEPEPAPIATAAPAQASDFDPFQAAPQQEPESKVVSAHADNVRRDEILPVANDEPAATPFLPLKSASQPAAASAVAMLPENTTSAESPRAMPFDLPPSGNARSLPPAQPLEVEPVDAVLPEDDPFEPAPVPTPASAMPPLPPAQQREEPSVLPLQNSTEEPRWDLGQNRNSFDQQPATLPTVSPSPALLPTPAQAPEPVPLRPFGSTDPKYAPTAPPSFESMPQIQPAAAPASLPVQDQFSHGLSASQGARVDEILPADDLLLGNADFDPDSSSGQQTPELKIEKLAPTDAIIGEPLIYSIVVKNVGGSPAKDVVVEDRIPRGTRLEGTIPQAYLSEGKLTWQLGTLNPSEERKVQLKVVPLEAGQIGSVATVSFAAAVSASIRVTAPDLKISMTGPNEAVVGEKIPYQFTLTNAGQGVARAVYLRAILPEGLTHPGGNDLEYEVGQLNSGEQRTIELAVVATTNGLFTPHASVMNDNKTYSETRADIHVLKSRLVVTRTGPSGRFVGRPATFTTTVTNETDFPLQSITVQETVPAGVGLAGLPQGGHWDPSRRLIIWSLPSLGPRESRQFTSQLVAESAGEHAGAVIAQDAAGNRAETRTALDVRGFADLDLDISSPKRTVMIGEQVSLRLTLRNDGSAPARDVRTRFQIPPGLQFAAAKGPVDYFTEGNVIEFASLEQIPVSGEQAFDIVLTAAATGQSKVTAHLDSADFPQTLLAEEPIQVITDDE